VGDFPGWIQCLVFSFSALTLSVRYKRDIQHRQHVKTGIMASHNYFQRFSSGTNEKTEGDSANT